MPSLWKRDNSPYWTCCYTGPDGRQLKRSTKQTNRNQALKVCLKIEEASTRAKQGQLTEVQARKIVGDIYEQVQGQALSFGEARTFLSEWINSKAITKASGTSARYKKTIDDFMAFLGERADQPLSGIVPRDIERFRDLQIQEGKSASTANMVIKTIRIPLNIARKRGLILSNPAEAVDMLSVDSNSRDTFSRDQIASLINQAKTDKQDDWVGMILFGACHGLRIGDAAKLTWNNMDFERSSICLVPAKTKSKNQGKREEYPLHPDVLEYLNTLSKPKAKTAEPLFPSLFKKKSNGTYGLSLTFRRLMHKAKIVTDEESQPRAEGKGRRFFSLGFHSLRHTAISEQANQGVSKEIRMKLSGHKSAVHERYTHHELEALRREIQKVPSFMETPKAEL